MESDGIEVLNCTVRSVVYSNEDTGYAVLSVVDTDDAEQKLTGIFPYAWAGETITAYGRWLTHPSYGRQFAADEAQRSDPEDENSVFAYLASGAVKGIGPVMAGQIVQKFGNKALQILEQEPSRLSEIRGISLGRAMKLSEEYRSRNSMKKLVLLLSGNGIAPEYAIRFYRFFGEESDEVVQQNPYLLTMDGIGAPFADADHLAEELGISESSPYRIRAGIQFVLRHNERNGHCFIP